MALPRVALQISGIHNREKVMSTVLASKFAESCYSSPRILIECTTSKRLVFKTYILLHTSIGDTQPIEKGDNT